MPRRRACTLAPEEPLSQVKDTEVSAFVSDFASDFDGFMRGRDREESPYRVSIGEGCYEVMPAPLLDT